MNILGCEFSSSPDMSAQIANIKHKFRTRMWILCHLAHCGLQPPDLLQVCRSVIFPCHDLSFILVLPPPSPINSRNCKFKCLNASLAMSTLRALLEQAGITILHQRRENRCSKFACKAAASESFASWFSRSHQPRPLRYQPPFKEFHAREPLEQFSFLSLISG